MQNYIDFTAAAKNTLDKRRDELFKELEQLKNDRRRAAVMASLLETLPKKLRSRVNPKFYFSGTFISATIRPLNGDGFTEHDTLLITDWCAQQDRWKFTKLVNPTTGTWRHELERWTDGKNWARYCIEFETTGNIDGCELIEEEVTETRKRYSVKC